MPSVVAILVAAIVLVTAPTLGAHDIPNDVTIQTFVKPEGSRLQVLVRVPLAAMRDLDYPKRGFTNSGLLDLARADSTLTDAATLWISDFLTVDENGAVLPQPVVRSVRAALASDPSFASYQQALAHVLGPKLPDDTEFVWAQGLLDVLFEYPIQSERSRFSIDPRFARLGIRTLTIVRFIAPDGTTRAFELQGDPGLVHLDPTLRQTAARFTALGFRHLLDGADYLLFLVCLVIPFAIGSRRNARQEPTAERAETAEHLDDSAGSARSAVTGAIDTDTDRGSGLLRSLVVVTIAFVLAHSVTLVAAAYGLAPDALWFRPLVDTVVATSIVALALANIAGASLVRRPAVAFACGLVQGFAYAFALRAALQLAGAHRTAAIASFALGLDLAQLVVVALAVPAMALACTQLVAPRIGTIVLSAIVAHTAWHWMLDRWSVLRQFRFEWPAFDLAFWANAMRWGMVAVVLAGLYWALGLLNAQGSTLKSQRR